MILAKAPKGFIAELTYGENVNWYRNHALSGVAARGRVRCDSRRRLVLSRRAMVAAAAADLTTSGGLS